MNSFIDMSTCEVGHKLIEALEYNKDYFEEEEFSSIINSIHTAIKYKSIESLSDILRGYKDYEDFVTLSSRNDNGVVCRVLNKRNIHMLFGDGKALHNFRGYGFQLSGNLKGQSDCGSIYSHIISNISSEFEDMYLKYFTMEIFCLMRKTSDGRAVKYSDLVPFLKATIDKSVSSNGLTDLGSKLMVNKYIFHGPQFDRVKPYTLIVRDEFDGLVSARIFDKGLKVEGKGIPMQFLEFCVNHRNTDISLTVLMKNILNLEEPEMIDSCYKTFLDLFISVDDVESKGDKSIADNYIIDTYM